MGGPLRVGVASVCITPQEPVQMAGYYYERISEGVHDDLYARAVTIADGKRSIAVVSLDLIHLTRPFALRVRRAVQKEVGIPGDHVMISATHTHTGPRDNRNARYTADLAGKVVESVRLAAADARPASLFVAKGRETSLSFNRRFWMRDGTLRTNPGILNPQIAHPAGGIDPDVLLLRVARRGRTRALLVNYALHCDTVGGNLISAGWSHYMRQKVQGELGADVDVVFLQGCCGDLNHWNVFKKVNLRGFAEAERIGSRLAESVLAALPGEKRLSPGKVIGLSKTVSLPAPRVSAREVAEAKRILKRPAPVGVDFTMDRVEAGKRLRASAIRSGRSLAEVQVLAFGDAAVVGLPGEIFNRLSRNIKRESPVPFTMVGELANGSLGYIGEAHNYAEGGYETTSSIVAPGGGEKLVATALGLLPRARRG